ncbi:Di-copper centre-containing protein [Trametopsis cervina]|nr:Di-copper centre-containing protein [Trametopsis cervina]
MSKFYEIVGFPDKVEVRHDVQHIADNEPDVWNLYILALDKIMKMDESQLTSYFQISAIHGLPHIPWDNVGDQVDDGYCAHRTVVFPTWHRVYMLLFEQVLQKEAVAIAEQYTDTKARDVFRKAAQRFRLPYWDWAASPELPPKLFDEKITVSLPPLANQTQIDNPLYTYRFQNNTATSYGFHEPFTVWAETIRNPPNAAKPNVNDKSQPDRLQQQLRAQHRQLRARVYNMLMFTDSWEGMSNAVQGGSASSLEGVHDTVHVILGDGGHMGNVPVAAFDPIFWYHHANVDRLLALWQALNPDSRVPSGSGPNEKSELTPFHIDNSTFWTSDKTYDGRAVGNRYPEYPAEDVSSAELKEIVRDHVEKLYGPKFKTSGVARIATSTTDEPEQTSLTNNYRDWVVNISINTDEYPRSGYVHVFLCKGEPKGNPIDWLTHEDEVGVVAIFKNESKLCANCNRLSAENVKINGQVFLTGNITVLTSPTRYV